ncbi:acyl-CoA oxidase [Flavobacterium cyanobacteriorum]|uniref:acyl-CoA oxidase n=1 Tax=Flavobacterium cyanobacteriorum TaxID=2022802 RepID=A0A255ZKV3_9FLAO|nr:acyl-CoA dehydrogenase [Flavobacterium cyanobacteriorum]OYQ42029.1 acyl-CoA oxidase [Flavobacterium cyanobacteriorum]
MDITFINDPKLCLLLPYIYVAWEDDIMTKKEFGTLHSFISGQEWLTKAEKDFLKQKIDYDSPPSRTEMSQWKEMINRALTTKSPKTLFELGFSVANTERDAIDEADYLSAVPEFAAMEASMGIMGTQVMAGLPNDRDTITTRYSTVESFNISEMAALLDGEQGPLINSVREIIGSKEFELGTTTDTAAYRELVMHWCRLLAEKGLGAYAYPTGHGGRNDIEGYFAIMETLSYHDLSLVIKFGVQFGLWGMSILSLGTEKHYRKYLKQVGTLELPGCFAMTETHHGSNVKGIETTATYNHAGRTFTICTPTPFARKEYIGNAAVHGEMATVFAKLIIDGHDYGVNAFIVPIRDKNKNTLPGITIEDCGRKMGLNGVDNGIISFTNVVIPYENMLDRFANVNEQGEFESPIPSDNRRFFTMLGTLVGGRIGIPQSALSAAKTGLAIAIQYGDKRRQFGPENGREVPVLNYRMHQLRLMPYLAKAYALHFGLQYLTKRFVNRKEDDMQEIEALAAGMKAYTTWNTRNTLQECREACGGKGYITENRIDSLKNDTEIYTTFEGDNTVLMQLVAKYCLKEARKEFGEMNVSTVLSYFLEKAKTGITEKNPFATRNTDEAHLKDPQFHQQAFQYREKELTASAARRFKKLVDNGLDAFDAANVMHPHMLQVAYAYLDRVFLEQFAEKISTCENKILHEVLTRLYNLFALHRLEENKGWYLEQGYMEGPKTKAIQKMVSQLCWEIRQDAVPLTHAFHIPKNCLAPIVTTRIEEAS